MLTKQVRQAILGDLFALYQAEGRSAIRTREYFEEQMPDAKSGVIYSVLWDLKTEGVITFSGNMARLTTRGAALLESPPDPPAPSIAVHGGIHGNVQLGNNNQQTITYQTVLASLTDAIEKSGDIPEEQKRGWVETLKQIAAHPLTQTVLGAAGGAAATYAGK